MTTSISNLEYISYDSNGNIVLSQDTTSAGSGSMIVMTTEAGVTTTETIDAAAQNDLTTDSLNFEGRSITGNITRSGDTDSYGRTYTLNGSDLSITDGSDSLTISNFQNGDFGLVYLNDNHVKHLRRCA